MSSKADHVLLLYAHTGVGILELGYYRLPQLVVLVGSEMGKADGVAVLG